MNFLATGRNIFVILVFMLGCKPNYKNVHNNYQLYRISNDSIVGSEPKIQHLILPYKQHLDSIMNEVLCENAVVMQKELPEGNLNNFFCDVLLDYSRQHLTNDVDVCIYNYGGIRLPAISTGPITLGKVYELMPFENNLVRVKITGTELNELMQYIASLNGAPLAGIRYCIQDKKAVNIIINGVALDLNKTYSILTNDYIAKGGDKYPVLKNNSSIELNIKVRDAIIQALKIYGQKNQKLNFQKDGRVCQ